MWFSSFRQLIVGPNFHINVKFLEFPPLRRRRKQQQVVSNQKILTFTALDANFCTKFFTVLDKNFYCLVRLFYYFSFLIFYFIIFSRYFHEIYTFSRRRNEDVTRGSLFYLSANQNACGSIWVFSVNCWLLFEGFFMRAKWIC